jgi:pimeloyl-ACP methyl ester carboxylesterase
MRLLRAACTLSLLVATLPPQPLAAQSRIVHDTLFSPALDGNQLGDSATREVLVYLPPSYDSTTDRRYPVLYLLHGFTSLPSEWLDGSYPGLNLQTMMDSLLVADSIGEFLVVMPDAGNRLGGGFYTNSPVAGAWADFVVQDLVGHVDANYRTLADRTHRALAGHSMGGYGALVLGFANPQRFGLLYAMSPACVAFAGELAPTSDAWAVAAAATTYTVPRSPAGARFIVALAAALSPAPDKPRLYGELPFQPNVAGKLIPRSAVLSHWQARMPLGLIPAFARDPMKPQLDIEFGTADQIACVPAGVTALTHALDRARVHYSLTLFDGGHVDRMPERIGGALLPAVGRYFQGR